MLQTYTTPGKSYMVKPYTSHHHYMEYELSGETYSQHELQPAALRAIRLSWTVYESYIMANKTLSLLQFIHPTLTRPLKCKSLPLPTVAETLVLSALLRQCHCSSPHPVTSDDLDPRG